MPSHFGGRQFDIVSGWSCFERDDLPALKSTDFVLSVAPPGTNITLITEEKYFFDFYKRQLAYIILPDGSCLNEILIIQGYAKAMGEYYCSNLAKYQQLNFLAKQSEKGLYAFTPNF